MLESTFVPPIFVIDTSVICHNIKNVIRDSINLNTQENLKTAAIYADLALKWTNALGFLPMSLRPKEAVVVWVADSKPYWRSQFFPNYKHGRSTPPPFYYSLLSYVKAQYSPLAFNQYEADDVAALIYLMWKSKQANYSGLNLVTCDTDWMGLCSPGVTWMDTGGYAPRIRKEPDVKAWIVKKQLKGTKHAKMFSIPDKFEARHLFDFKIHTGDSSDNLPAYCPPYLIDLLKPHPSFTLWNDRSAVSEAAKYLTTSKPIEEPLQYHFSMSRMGFNVPIPPITDEAFCAA